MGIAQESEQDRQRRRRDAAAWGFLLLFAIGFHVVGAAVMMIGFSSADCRFHAERPVCNPSIQELAAYIAIGGLAAGLLLIALGGGLAVRRRRSSAPWQGAAWILMFVALAVAFLVADV